jgi:transcriptional regulator with XRE-family HTH domain
VTLVLTAVSCIGLKNHQGNEYVMSDTSSWQDLLKDIISNPVEREQLAKAVGVRPVTLYRWMTSESSPRPHNLRQLLSALPYEQRNRMAALLEKAKLDFSESSMSDSPDQLEFPFVRQVLELRATTPDVVLFWTLCHKVFQHALRRLDPERIGMSIRVVLCMPPGSDGKIHSLRESVGQGTPPWRDELEQDAIFLGAESLAGYVVTSCRPAVVQDLASENFRLPAHRAEHELSAVAAPILYSSQVAGCVLVSSTQTDYFDSSSRLSLITDYTQLIALAFKPEQFYPPEWLELRVMPSFDAQRVLLTSFRERVIALMKEAIKEERPLTHTQAEQLAWQQLEEELIYIASSKTEASSLE